MWAVDEKQELSTLGSWTKGLSGISDKNGDESFSSKQDGEMQLG